MADLATLQMSKARHVVPAAGTFERNGRHGELDDLYRRESEGVLVFFTRRTLVNASCLQPCIAYGLAPLGCSEERGVCVGPCGSRRERPAKLPTSTPITVTR
jgi:hypothetical protein